MIWFYWIVAVFLYLCMGLSFGILTEKHSGKSMDAADAWICLLTWPLIVVTALIVFSINRLTRIKS